MPRLNFAVLAAALVIAAPAAAWEPSIVGLDDPSGSAATAPSVASDQVAAAPREPHVVGIDDAGDLAQSAPSAAVEGIASATPWEPEIVGLYHEDDLQPDTSDATAGSDAAGSDEVAAVANGVRL